MNQLAYHYYVQTLFLEGEVWHNMSDVFKSFLLCCRKLRCVLWQSALLQASHKLGWIVLYLVSL